MSSKFMFAIVSKDKDFKMKQDAFSCIADSRCVFVEDNKRSLAEVYNEQIEAALRDGYDYLAFMHSDVSLDIASFAKHVEECSSKYDVMGLCGTEHVNVSASPLDWFTSSKGKEDKRWGSVIHGELSNQLSYFSKHSPDVFDHEVAAVDGLCIVLTRKAMEAGLRFDPVFKFDFYDLDLCFQCLMKYHLKVGCLVQKDLYHYSVGRSILQKEFLEHEKDFRMKWNIQLS